MAASSCMRSNAKVWNVDPSLNQGAYTCALGTSNESGRRKSLPFQHVSNSTIVSCSDPNQPFE